MSELIIPNNINEMKSTKEKVLAFLEANSCIYLSGQDIADTLFLTRAGVWKAITSLRKEGYNIDAVSNRGYRIISPVSECDSSYIKNYLSELGFNYDFNIHVFDEIDSTNDYAKSIALNDNNIHLIISSSQTRGRGRRGRTFYSPSGSGIYISLLLHPSFHIEDSSLITCMSAVALKNAIYDETGIETSIKWVNDLYYKEKKIAGILTEAQTSIEDGTFDYLVVGFGLNLFYPSEGFPAEIRSVAGALFDKGQMSAGTKERLCASLISYFFKYYDSLEQKSFVDDYRNSSFLIGKHVKINSYKNEDDLQKKENQSNKNYALVKDIDENCHLVIEYEDGSTAFLSSGEVSVVKY